jgi:hypothetical protein
MAERDHRQVGLLDLQQGQIAQRQRLLLHHLGRERVAGGTPGFGGVPLHEHLPYRRVGRGRALDRGIDEQVAQELGPVRRRDAAGAHIAVGQCGREEQHGVGRVHAPTGGQQVAVAAHPEPAAPDGQGQVAVRVHLPGGPVA